MDPKQRLILEQRAIQAMKERIAGESYLSIGEVCQRLGVHRSIIEGLPMEVLPWVPFGNGGKRVHRRYHPAAVVAADGRIRAWHRARQEGRGAEYLAQLRAELEELDRATHRAALEAARAVA